MARKNTKIPAPAPRIADVEGTWTWGLKFTFGTTRMDEVLATFAERLAADPHDALSWGEDAFTAAAERRTRLDGRAMLDTALSRGLDRVAALNEVADRLMEQALNGARFPPRSTSQSSNLAAQCLTSAQVRIAEELRGFAASLAKEQALAVEQASQPTA